MVVFRQYAQRTVITRTERRDVSYREVSEGQRYAGQRVQREPPPKLRGCAGCGGQGVGVGGRGYGGGRGGRGGFDSNPSVGGGGGFGGGD